MRVIQKAARRFPVGVCPLKNVSFQGYQIDFFCGWDHAAFTLYSSYTNSPRRTGLDDSRRDWEYPNCFGF
jgi:hypothetical protein